MQVLKNLYQVGGDLNGVTFDLQGALWNDANSYILKTDEGLIMFDCGCGNTMEQIFNNMKYWDLSPNDIRYCILTHPHPPKAQNSERAPIGCGTIINSRTFYI